MDNFEQNIIAKCQQGQLESFGLLYDKYIEKIYKFVYFKTNHKETAEDITSQVFLKAFNNINSFDNKGSFNAWLYQIARNSIIDFYRLKKNEINIEDIFDLSDQSDIERDMDVKVKLEKVEKYLKHLKPEQREIIMLRIWGQMSYKEIAEILGKSESSCKMMFSRTITVLRKEMPIYLLLHLLLLNL